MFAEKLHAVCTMVQFLKLVILSVQRIRKKYELLSTVASDINVQANV
jgi:hypothetical protein